MLDYSKIHENPPEVLDPVSGDFFPASYSDIKAQKQAEKAQKEASYEDAKMVSMFTSLMK